MVASRVSSKIDRPGPIAWFVMLLPLISLCLAGCGKPARELAPLTGKVTYAGKPLRFGAITIEHEYGQPARSRIGPDGTFSLSTHGEGEGAAVGKRRVRIACFEGQDPARQTNPNTPVSLGRLLIPEKYTSFETSGIVIDVRPGKNEPVVLNLVD